MMKTLKTSKTLFFPLALILLCPALIFPAGFSQEPAAVPENPEIRHFINDYYGILSSAQVSELEPILKEIYDSGIAEYSIVIIGSLNGEDIEGYAYRLAQGNLGDEKKNNGLLLLVAFEDRLYRFETGRGLEPVLPDIILGRIGRNYLAPNFREGDYAKGLKEASLSVRDTLFNSTDSAYYLKEEEDPAAQAIAIIFFFLIFFAIFILPTVLTLIYVIKKAKKRRLEKDETYFLTAAWVLGELLKGGGRGGGSFGSGRSGGGFGGFGGGSFGGGGASGRW